jgi:Arylsulfotransferase (ASST)
MLAAVAALIAIVAVPGRALAQPSARPAVSAAVSVYPIAGSRVASPHTQIAFRGIPVSELGQITVTGSVSGVHAGAIESDSDGDGGSFLPAKPFTAGETVTVRTSLNIVGASGGTFRFTVATPAGGIPPTRWPAAGRASGDVFRYHSRPDLAPAAARWTRWSSRAAPGDIFVASQFGPVQDGPEIIGPGGGLIWFDPLTGDSSAADFRVQRYRGQPVLTWWQGYVTAGVGVGVDEIYNSSYQPVAVVRAANGLSADEHEFQLTSQNTALITAYFPVYWDASSVGGSKHELMLDSVVQEIDVPTGLVLFQWDSLDHVPLSESYEPLPTGPGWHPFDYFHVNSIQQDYDGNLLISARNTWAAYKVNIQTGAIMWELGGKNSSFRLAPGTYWAFQHDVEAQANNDLFVTLFDDASGPPVEGKQSRAIKLILDLKHMTARQVAQHAHQPPLLSSFEGNFQQLPNHDDFVGWGQQPYFSEYDPSGRLIFDGHFVDATASYRAYRFPWSGTPATPPTIAYTGGRTPTVYASWNGATNVFAWRVLGGASPTQLHPVASAQRSWFETWIRLASAQRYLAVQALDSSGHVLGTSGTLATH